MRKNITNIKDSDIQEGDIILWSWNGMNREMTFDLSEVKNRCGAKWRYNVRTLSSTYYNYKVDFVFDISLYLDNQSFDILMIIKKGSELHQSIIELRGQVKKYDLGDGDSDVIFQKLFPELLI